MGRNSFAEAERTRDRIVREAVAVASVSGLEGLTIGGLADRLQLSKSGVVGHFGSKFALQLATLEEALRVFRAAVWEPVKEIPAGRDRLLALCDRWLALNGSGRFPGGCFLTTTSVEFDGRPGPVRDAIRTAMKRWLALLEREVRFAQDRGEIAAEVEPAQVAFEINALATAANMAFQLHADRAAFARARAGIERLLLLRTP